MRTFVFLLALLQSATSFAGNISCYGWYQTPGAAIETVPMPVKSSTSQGITYTATYKNYVYTAAWDFKLTSFNISFATNGARLLSTTARVPTDNHPENFTDLNLPGGPRLSITCELK